MAWQAGMGDTLSAANEYVDLMEDIEDTRTLQSTTGFMSRIYKEIEGRSTDPATSHTKLQEVVTRAEMDKREIVAQETAAKKTVLTRH